MNYEVSQGSKREILITAVLMTCFSGGCILLHGWLNPRHEAEDYFTDQKKHHYVMLMQGSYLVLAVATAVNVKYMIGEALNHTIAALGSKP